MDGRIRRGSYHATTQQTPPHQGANTTRPTTQYNQDRRSTPIFSPMRHEFERYSISHHYDPGYDNHQYQDQQMESQQIPTSNSMQGIETQYPPYAQNAMRNSSTYQTADNHPLSTYTPSSILPPMQQTALFEPFSNYGPRASTIMEQMGSALQVNPYLSTNDQNSACMAAAPAQYVTSHADRTMYGSALCRPNETPSFSITANSYSEEDVAALQTGEEQDQPAPDTDSDLLRYEQQLKEAFEMMIAGRLNQAANVLISASRSLLSSVVRLELHIDVPDDYNSRLCLWREFNHCWEALAQKQKDVILMEMNTEQKASDSLNPDKIRSLVDELISMCDQIDQYGLVDYEIGVWEDQIVGAFECCLDLMEQIETSRAGDPKRPRGKA